MKQVFFSLLPLIPLFVHAQITITQNDMPSAGDVYFSDNAVPDLTIDLSQAGANQTWDFSNLLSVASAPDSFIAANDLPSVYQLFFLFSNLAEKNAFSLSFGQLTLDDVYTVYKKSSSQFQIDGYAGTVDGVPLPVVYSSKDIVYRFPLNYGNSDSSDAFVNFSIPGLIYFEQHRHRVNAVDGWGTMITPAGSYDALRVKSTIVDVDSLYADTISSGYSITLKSYEYKWLGQGKGIPVVQINAQDVLGSLVISQIFYQDTALQSGVAGNILNSSFKVFPNPSNEFIQLKLPLDLAAEYFFYDAEGKLMDRRNYSGSLLLDVSEWKTGLYFVRCIQDERYYYSSFLVTR